uniref:Teneurin-like YD-shell domain-containing protein n=1 Tax=Prevotella sp. GTC17253 TaxID=3236793 RepID=A0AB33IR42_9BACT
MTQDYNKKISKIGYNSVNLPSKLQFCYGHLAEYAYDATGRKLRVTFTTSKTNLLVAMGSIVPPQATNVATTLKTDYCGNMIYEDGKLSKILTDEGYISFKGNAPVYHYYLRDHLGSIRVVIDDNGSVEQVNHYCPFGGLFGESTGGGTQPYKYNGKELDRMHGLDWYDYGARHSDAVLGRWMCMDPLAEKYYDVTPYGYCGNDPVNRFDPDGMDWYRDKDGTYQFSPGVHSQADLQKGQLYLWKSHQFKTINYRDDGSIIYANETAAYNRMWNQADKHYRQKYHRGREVGAFILTTGYILVLPDYNNNFNTSNISQLGYVILGNGKIRHGQEIFKVSAQIHTHQKGCGDASPSYVGKYSDAIISEKISRPVFTMSHDGNVWYIIANQNSQNINITPFKVKELLRGFALKGSFVKYAGDPAWKRFGK